MSQHRLLGVRRDPVEQVYGLGFAVVVSGDLLGQQADQERLELEVPVKQPKLFQHDLRTLHSLGVFVVVELVDYVFLHRLPRLQLPLHLVLHRQLGIIRGKMQDVVDRAKQLLGLRSRESGLT